MEKQQFQLSIAGLGIIFYAPHAVRHIEEGKIIWGNIIRNPKMSFLIFMKVRLSAWQLDHRESFI